MWGSPFISLPAADHHRRAFGTRAPLLLHRLQESIGCWCAPASKPRAGRGRNVGKDKEKDPIDEAIDESFPASDPPSWTASPPRATLPGESPRRDPVDLPAAVQRGAEAVAQQLTRMPADFLFWTGLALAATSAGLLLA